MSSLGLKDTYVGSQAQTLRGILSLSHPIRQGIVQDWDDLEAIWSHIWNAELKTEASNQPVIITQAPLASEQEEAKMAEILIEKLEVPAMFIANKSVMSLYGGGNMTGISVDSGHDTTYIVPSYQGNAVQDATLVLKIGGHQAPRWQHDRDGEGDLPRPRNNVPAVPCKQEVVWSVPTDLLLGTKV